MIAIFALLVFCTFVPADASTGCSKCRYQRVHGMYGVDCFDTGLREVPQCLKPSIEVLDLSYNRIRKIRKSDLESYTSLRYLYLSDNMITDIEEEALLGKTSLEILDISINTFNSIPKVIFQLPSLRRLYMNQNHNTNVAEEIEKAKPILSPLTLLDIGYNIIRELPNLGELPGLEHYNISGNQDVLLKTSHFAGLCTLKMLVMQNFSAVFENPCDCMNLRNWLLNRKVTLIEGGFNCEDIDCPYNIPQEDLEIYTKCLENHQTKVVQNTLLTIVLPVLVCVLIIICVVLVYVCNRRRNKRHRKTSVQYKVTRPLYKEPL